MRLLKLQNGKPSLVEFFGDDIPPYAILSHTWGRDEEEFTFKDIVDDTGELKAGYAKVQFCIKQAAENNLHFSWVDTCCIDKSSSAELSEAINSMFLWYCNATKCYVYLSDVLLDESIEYVLSSPQTWKLAFQRSKWFTRGWTLQELVAPTSVEFFSKERKRLGDKNSLVRAIHETTGISVQALKGCHLSEFSVDERMSWTKNRKTKREEDAAYCLLGIFDVNMGLRYGEGREKAFIRLQKKIKVPLNNGPHIPPRGIVNDDNGQNQERSLNSVHMGSMFNGPMSSRYAMSGTHVGKGGTLNITLPEKATAKRRCNEDCSIGNHKRVRVTSRPSGDQNPRQYRKPDNGDEGGSEGSNEGGSEDSEEGSSEDDDDLEDDDEGGSEDSNEGSEEGSEEDSEGVDLESESDFPLELSQY